MGFRTGAYATVWEIEPISETNTKIRISVSKKNKEDGKYETEFSGYANCYGTAAAHKASLLKEKDKIKLGNVDLTTYYHPEKKVVYYNPKIFSFDLIENREEAKSSVDNGEPEEPESFGEEELPF